MIRITFEAVGDWRWYAGGHGDERVDIAIPRPGETEADLSVFNSPEYGRGWVGEEPPWRHYTVRAVRQGGRELDIDFVVHGGGIASGWAERAEPGHLIGVFGEFDEHEHEHDEAHDHDHGGSSSYYNAPADAGFQLLVADATGLPGLGRILEELEPGIRAIAIVEVADDADIQQLTSPADVELIWRTGTGNGYAPSVLADEVAKIADPGEPWYAWVACEAATSRAIRRDLRTRLGLARDRHHAIGFWTQNESGDQSVDVG